MRHLPLIPRIALRMCVATLCFLFMWQASINQPRAEVRPDAVGSPAAIAAAHDCWNDFNPHPVPAHVVIQIVKGQGAGTVMYMGKVVTDATLSDIGHSVTVPVKWNGKVRQTTLTALYYCV